MLRKKVIIIGGGVAGMSAAHELANRNFDVEIYQNTDISGGKARSTLVPDSATQGRKPLPGEHGFRFFPRFYKHITTTMAEIPFGNKTVADNLTETTEIKLARFGQVPVQLSARFPRSLKELENIINDATNAHLGLTENDKKDFAFKVWQLITTCKDRRMNEYERIGWWEFLDADQHSEVYQTIFVRGLTRTLVAARAESASTKTGGNIFLQLIFDIATPGISSDRILNGPTNEVWIDPWKEYLTKQKGVKLFYNAPATHIAVKNQKISSITVNDNGTPRHVDGDYYILATPVEVASSLINHDLLIADPTLENIIELSKSVAWMNGIQFYLKQDVQINHGHTIYIDSPWALTSISQKQFWQGYDFSKVGDGTVNGILSVDVSDWETPGILYNKPANQCTKQEIANEIWAQLKKSLNSNGTELLSDENLHSFNLDDDIVFGASMDNKEPLLVNTVNSWDLRPYAYTRIPNLFLASDYVKTYTDLATMEGANEAARRAVNCILDDSGSRAKKCQIWDLSEPWIFAVFRWIDKKRYQKGLPWNPKQPFILSLITSATVGIHRLFTKSKK